MSAWWRRLARRALAIAVLLAVIVSVSPVAIGDRLAQADLRFVVPAVLGLAAMHIVPAAGWRSILATTTGVRLPWATALALFYAAQAIGGITPANLGGDIHRATTLRGSGHGWSVAVAPLIVQRATSYLALSVLSMFGLVVLATHAASAPTIVAGGAIFAGAVAVAAWLLLAPPAPLRGAHARLARLIGGAPEPDDGRVRRPGTATVIGLGHGLAFHAGSIGLTWLLVLAVDPATPAGPVLAALTVARLSLAVPLAPSGLGVQEGALVVLFVALGLPGEVALAAMLLARLSLVLTTVIGAGLLMRPGPSLAAKGNPPAAAAR